MILRRRTGCYDVHSQPQVALVYRKICEAHVQLKATDRCVSRLRTGSAPAGRCIPSCVPLSDGVALIGSSQCCTRPISVRCGLKLTTRLSEAPVAHPSLAAPTISFAGSQPSQDIICPTTILPKKRTTHLPLASATATTKTPCKTRISISISPVLFETLPSGETKEGRTRRRRRRRTSRRRRARRGGGAGRRRGLRRGG